MMVYFLLLTTCVLWGATPILEKMALSRQEPLVGLFIRNAVVLLGTFVWLCFSGKLGRLTTCNVKDVSLFSLTGLMAGVIAMLTYFYALKMGATSKVVPIVATYPLVTLLLSICVLHERVTVIRVVGTGLILIGIWCVR